LPSLRREEHYSAVTRQRVKALERREHAAEQARSGHIGAAIREQTRPIAHRSTWIDTHELPAIRARQRAAEHAIPADQAGLRDWAGSIEGSISGLWSRVRHLDKLTAGIGATALVVVAMAKLGIDYLRCSNVQRAAKRLCRMDPSALEDLLALTL